MGLPSVHSRWDRLIARLFTRLFARLLAKLLAGLLAGMLSRNTEYLLYGPVNLPLAYIFAETPEERETLGKELKEVV